MQKPLLFAPFVLLSLSVVLHGCAKSPTSDFTLAKNEYCAGEFIMATNHSEDARSYKWSILDESGFSIAEATDRNPDLRIPLLAADGGYSVTLVSYSKKEKKSQSSHKKILVKTRRGKVQVYLSSSSGYSGEFALFADHEKIATSSQGFLQAEVPSGIRLLEARGSSRTWKTTVDVGFSSNGFSYQWYLQ